jgi:hypothetical protein
MTAIATPAIRTPEGWLVLHHGVSGKLEPGVWHQRHVRYAAGAMLLDAEERHPGALADPSALLHPQTPRERDGIVPNVVFPPASTPAATATPTSSTAWPTPASAWPGSTGPAQLNDPSKKSLGDNRVDVVIIATPPADGRWRGGGRRCRR